VDQLQKAAPGLLAEPAGPLQLPPGYVIRYTGENEDKEESQTFMSRAFLTALLLVFLVLVIEFNSLLQTVIIMVSVILSFIGVFLGLIVTHQPFGIIMTGMAVISLAGVVVNNAIVLLDYINVLRQRGMSCGEAIIQAGATRFRPVMLTAVTCVLGLVPMALKLSYNFYEWRWDYNTETSQWWTSLANALIFGMMVATVLTLFVVPYVYSLIFDFRGKSLEPVAIPAENSLLFEGEPQTETEEGEMDKPEEGNL
jgi:multidrug efflux pump subunit AcrB